jgi:TonB family protein
VLRSASIVAFALGLVLQPEAFSPARYRSGPLPALPALAVGGGQVFLELTVNREGRVSSISPLRTTPSFTDAVIGAVSEWDFDPAEKLANPGAGRTGDPATRMPAASTVLVAAVFRPPALYGPTAGQPPIDIAAPSGEAPFPLSTAVPRFPPMAHGAGIVLMEVLVDRNGAIADAAVVQSAPPFDEAARQALSQWTFQPARVEGVPVSSLVYVMFGFPVPIGVAGGRFP